jgi:hypothetical protein
MAEFSHKSDPVYQSRDGAFVERPYHEEPSLHSTRSVSALPSFHPRNADNTFHLVPPSYALRFRLRAYTNGVNLSKLVTTGNPAMGELYTIGGKLCWCAGCYLAVSSA